MGKKYIALVSLLVILSFIGYIVYDTISSGKAEQSEKPVISEEVVPDKWFVFNTLQVSEGSLTSVAVSGNGEIFVGGESFASCYYPDLTKKWTLKTPEKIGAISISGDTLYAASTEILYLISMEGRLIGEWGPYEAKSIITSLSANKHRLAFADAGNKRIFILKRNGEVIAMIGQSDNSIIIPSAYFDVALAGSNNLYLANTGQRRIEKWTTSGVFVSQFGEPGTAPGAFCGCCNPAHFAVIPQGFVTAEKGINRIKILDKDGKFIEFVSSKNSFTQSVPLDVASADGITIYAANPVDSKLYVFKKR